MSDGYIRVPQQVGTPPGANQDWQTVGVPVGVQPALSQGKIDRFLWNGAAGTPTFGDTSLTTLGTVSFMIPASTRYGTQFQRMAFTSAAAGGSVGGVYSNNAGYLRYWLGNAVGVGGFHVSWTFEADEASLVATANMFAGLTNSIVAPTDVGPQTLTNLVGVGCTNGDTVLQLYAAGVAAQARTALPATFPVNSVSTDVYRVDLYSAPNSQVINVAVVRLNVPSQAPFLSTVTVAAQLPSNTTFLAPTCWRSNGGTASAVAVSVVNGYGYVPVSP